MSDFSQRRRNGRYGPKHPHLGRLAARISRRAVRALGRRLGTLTLSDRYAKSRIAAMRAELDAGRAVLLLGVGVGGHDSGLSLVEASPRGGIEILATFAEDRFVQKKRYGAFPSRSVAALREYMDRHRIEASSIHAVVSSFDYPEVISLGFRAAFEEAPASFRLARLDVVDDNLREVVRAFVAPDRLSRALGLEGRMPIIGMPHHGNHAAIAWAGSPFCHQPGRTLIAAIDATGDTGSISIYLGEDGRLRQLHTNESYWESLGFFYSFMSSSFGGWPFGSAEGRWMAAAAFGEQDRESNPYYEAVASLLSVDGAGRVQINRELANWPRRGSIAPFTPAIEPLIAQPIPASLYFHPEVTLRFSNGPLNGEVRRRVDQAAATQLVFEDAIAAVLEPWLVETGASRLILTGGTALNCVSNLKLLERFDEAFYAKKLGQPDTRLQLWVPPAPGDDGAHPGAAHHFALLAGARPAAPIRHCFHGSSTGRRESVLEEIKGIEGVECADFSDTALGVGRRGAADFLAYLIEHDAIVGLYQGRGEMGPRALGHRSILANPRSADVAERINRSVKYREDYRPVAPMCTLAVAREYFHLCEGAAADDYSAYRWMTLAARAKPRAIREVPAVVHVDGTVRPQIVGEEDPFTFSVLRRLEARIGLAMAVNTSLNLGTPLVETPAQAAHMLTKSPGLGGILFLSDDGAPIFVWRRQDDETPSGRPSGRHWVDAWHRMWESSGVMRLTL